MLFICLGIYSSIYLFVCLFVCLFVYMQAIFDPPFSIFPLELHDFLPLQAEREEMLSLTDPLIKNLDSSNDGCDVCVKLDKLGYTALFYG